MVSVFSMAYSVRRGATTVNPRSVARGPLYRQGTLPRSFLRKRLEIPRLVVSEKHIMFSMLDWADCREVERSEDKVSGAWVFRGTRVPVRALFENLETGATIDQFLEWFPGVTPEQVVAVLEHAEQSLAEV